MSLDSKSKSRVTVEISAQSHHKLSSIAKLLGLDLKQATAEAVEQWSERNSGRAQKKATEILK